VYSLFLDVKRSRDYLEGQERTAGRTGDVQMADS